VGHKGELPADRRGGDPQVTYVLLLMQGVAESAALVAQSGIDPGGLVVDRQYAAPVQQAFDGFKAPLAPVGRDRAVADLGHALLRDGDATTEDMLPHKGRSVERGLSQAVRTFVSSRTVATLIRAERV
jgi:hypothetical protein